MGARGFLILGVFILLFAWLPSATGMLRHTPAIVRYFVAAIFILGAVRIGLSIAIIAFDLSALSLLIPILCGLLAFWFRPGREPAV